MITGIAIKLEDRTYLLLTSMISCTFMPAILLLYHWHHLHTPPCHEQVPRRLPEKLTLPSEQIAIALAAHPQLGCGGITVELAITAHPYTEELAHHMRVDRRGWV